MPVADETTEERVKGFLSSGLQALLRHAGTDDHGEVVWASFSDDEGQTRVIFRALRQDETRAFSLLADDELLLGLSEARRAGKRKVIPD